MKKLTGLFAAVALMSSGMALANEGKQQDKQQTQSQSGTGGAGSQSSDHGMSKSSGSLGGAGQSGSTQGTGSDIGGSGSQTGAGTSGTQAGSGSSTGSGSSVTTGSASGSGTSGTTGTTGSQMGQSGQSGMTDSLAGNQITGRVVKSDRKTVWVEHAGAIVPLKVDKNTQFGDPSLKRASDLREGDEIRASFEVRKTDNVATSIQKNTDVGQGGSGSDAMMPDQGINDTLPPSNDIGGSGANDLGSDITNQGSDLGTGSDVNQGNKASGDF
jgi:hypothetical protein